MASAIAVTFSILILTFMLAQYLSTTFPNQMQAAELQHSLSVENQFESLQTNIALEVQHPSTQIAVTTPVSLSGYGVPPFGPASGSTLSAPLQGVDNASFEIESGGTSYFEGFSAGLTDVLNNRYSAAETVDYEEGALVLGNAGGSTMLSGPDLTINPASGGGLYVNLVLVQFLPRNLTTSEGYGTVGVETWLVSESTVNFATPSVNGAPSQSQFLTIGTLYPQAWLEWIADNPSIFLSGGSSTCGPTVGATLPVCQVTATMQDAQLTFTAATVGITMNA